MNPAGPRRRPSGRSGKARLDEFDHAAATLTQQHHGRLDRRGGAGVEPWAYPDGVGAQQHWQLGKVSPRSAAPHPW
jgi:hypothetical protein